MLKIAEQRAQFLQAIRNFFTKNGFLEVETPIMTRIPGMEPHLTPFEISNSDTPLYLNTSPELQMKKLLGQDFENIFQLTKVFRNEPLSQTHNSEFTMLEWYRTNADYFDIMKDCENLILSLTEAQKVTYQSREIDLTPPWPRLKVHELFLKFCKIDLLKNQTFEKFKESAKKLEIDTKACQDWDDIFFKIFLNEIEPNLDPSRPTIIYDYPSSQAALAKISPKNPFFAERFELYIGGLELSNAFSELTDPIEQRNRLIKEQNLRKKLDKTVFPLDEEFLESLGRISHPCAGIALGIDRLLMLLMNKKTIREVLLFPTKPPKVPLKILNS